MEQQAAAEANSRRELSLAHDEAAIKHVAVWIRVDALTVPLAVATVLANIPAPIVVLEASGLQIHLVSHLSHPRASLVSCALTCL